MADLPVQQIERMILDLQRARNARDEQKLEVIQQVPKVLQGIEDRLQASDSLGVERLRWELARQSFSEQRTDLIGQLLEGYIKGLTLVLQGLGGAAAPGAVGATAAGLVFNAEGVLMDPPAQSLFDFEDGHGPVPAHRHRNPDGSLGGWVAGTAQVADKVSVGPQAEVYGKALIHGGAKIYGHARAYENASVYGDVEILGRACVYGQAHLYGDDGESSPVWISGEAQIYGEAEVYAGANIYGNARIYGRARVFGCQADLSGGYYVGQTHVRGDARVHGQARVTIGMTIESGERT